MKTAMMDGGKYSSGIGVSIEKIAASMLVVLWIAIAYHMAGIRFASRTALLFSLPLASIWIPDLMARLSNQPDRKYGLPPSPVGPRGFRIVAWFVILGVPAAWVLFSLIATRG